MIPRSEPRSLGDRMRFAAVVASAFLCFWTAVAVAEEPPAALVMAVSGGTTPAMSEMSEIPSGAPLRLAPGTELTVLDYARCKMVTVSGATLSPSPFHFPPHPHLLPHLDPPHPPPHPLN